MKPESRVHEAPATVAGLFDAPCDPLLLAVGGPGEPLPGLTARLDWRLAGAILRHVRAGSVQGAPLLLPATRLLPAGRFVLFRRGEADADRLARCVMELGASPPGLCPEDFGLRPADVRAAFGDRALVLYRPLTRAAV